MASKEFSVAFRINGALNSSFASAMQAAQNAMKGLSAAARQVNSAMAGSMGTLQGYLSKLQSLAADTSKFANLKAAIPQTQSALQAEIAKTGQLAAAYRQQKAQVDAMKNAYQQLKDRQQALKTAYDSEKSSLQALKAQQTTLNATYKQAVVALGQNSQKAQELKTQLDNLKATIASQQGAVNSAKSAYDQLKAAVKSASTELRDAEKALSTLGNSFNQSKSKVSELYSTLQRQKSELASLKSSLSAAGYSTDQFIASEMKLRSEIAATTAAIERQRQAAASLSSAQSNLNSASTNFSEAQSAFNTVQQAVQTVAAPIQKSVETAMTFEHAMSRVKALTQSQNIREGKTDVVEKEFAALEKQALDLGATTKFSAIQAAEAMGFLGMAGWKTNQILGTMPGMLDLAAAAGADLAQTADIVSDNMTAMGVPVKEAPHFMDVYAYALTNSNARLTDFGETMKYAAPVAKAFGSSLDETAAMVMMMANAGIKGSMAGTSLRMGLLRLAGPPKTATKEMEKLGLSLSDAQAGALEAQAVIEGLGIDLKGATSPAEKMTRVIMQLHEKTKNLSQDEKLAAFKGIFGVNAETGWLALFDQGPEVFLKYVEGLRNADGYSRQVAQTMMDDTQGAITILESAMEGAYTAVGRALTPAIRGAAEAVAPLISAFTQWANKNPAIIQGVVGIIAALSGLALAVAGVAVAFTAWSFITSQIAMFSAGIAAVRAGMLATEVASMGMAARIGAAFASLQAFITGLSFSSIAASISKVGVAIRAAFLPLLANPIVWILAAIAAMAYVVYQNWDRIAPAMSQVGEAISSALERAGQAVDKLMTALSPIGDTISQALSDLLGIWKIDGFTDGIVAAFLGIVNVVVGVGVSIINVFTATVNTVTELFNGLGGVISAALDFDFDTMGNRAILLQHKIDKAWEGIDFSKADFGYDIRGNFREQYAAYKKAEYTQPIQKAAEQPSVLSQAAQYVAQPVAPAQAPVDTSPVQNAVNNVAQSTNGIVQSQDLVAQAQQAYAQQQTAAAQTQQTAQQQTSQAFQSTAETIQNFPQALQPVQEALANFPQSLQPAQEGLSAFGNAAMTAAPNVGQLGTASQTASDLVGQLGTASQTASDLVGQLGTAAGDASGNVGHLGTTAGNAAGSVGALDSAARSVASALEGAASKISSINITVPTITVGGAAPAANYKGGIYDKGAFLTWFAEKSPEAAIPLDKSQRAINLWTQAGQMLGVLPNDSPINLPADKPQAGSTLREVTSVQREKIKQAQKVYETAVKQRSSTSKILTERERYGTAEKLERQLEKVTELQTRVQNLQGSQIVNSRSYQAIKNAQQNSTYTRSSILNAPAQYDLPTDRYQNLSIGGFNLRDIPFIGKIFDKANDSIRGIFGKQPVDVFSGIGRNVEYDIMHPTGTFPTLPSENKSQGSLPTDIFKNIGGIDLGNIPIIGGLIDKANGALRGIFGKNPVDVFSGIQSKVDFDIMHPTETFPNLSPMASTLPTLESTNISPLEEVVPSASTSNYSAETFQPTFNITVNVTGGGENIDTQKIGEQIAFSARESFEKEYNNFMREKSRRGFA